MGKLSLTTNVASDASLTEATGARVEHPLVPQRIAPGNKREERTTEHENKFPYSVTAHPRPRYIQTNHYPFTH